MKCKLISGLIAGTLSCSALAQGLVYENPGLVLAPPDIPPQIDATTFINSGHFLINFTNDFFFIPDFPPNPGPPPPYEMANVLNYTNVFGAVMACNLGFRFEDFDTASGLRKPSANFHNSGIIECGTINTTNYALPVATVPWDVDGVPFLVLTVAGSKFTAAATNIVNRGTVTMGFESTMRLKGESLDLNHGTLTMENLGLSLNLATLELFLNGSIFDGYWGVSTNVISPAGFFEFTPAITPAHIVMDRQSRTFIQQLIMTNGLTYLRDELDFSGTNRFVRAAFVGNTNAQVQANVYFPDLGTFAPFFFGDIVVEYTNILGAVSNNLYVLDAYGVFTNQQILPHGFAGTRVTYKPFNYAVFQSPALQFGTPPETPVVIPLGTFNASNTTNQFSAYQALILPTSVVVGDLFGQDITNVPGRIDLVADKFLDVTHADISSVNYIQLKSTNHFAGSEGARISAPYIDMNLRSTNGLFVVTNLLAPTLGRPEGVIDLYSARWTNTTTALNPVTGVVGPRTNHYHVLFADAHFTSTAPSRGQNVILRSTNLLGGSDMIIISDELNITRSLLLDTARLLITTNDVSASNRAGGINLTDPRIVWSGAAPRLEFLTNYGFITMSNAVFFGGARSSPYYASNFNESYQVFENHGGITNFGMQIWANFFLNTGSLVARGGFIDLRNSQTAILTNGTLLAGGAISLASGTLILSNNLFQAGASINIAATNLLDDGSLLTSSANFITNKNVWLTRDGFSILHAPAQGSLLGTTISNSTVPFQKSIIRSAAADRGCSSEGFFNNAAVGRVILDGADGSVFEFSPVTGNNAIYIDSLELRNFTATNRDPIGNFVGLLVDPGMKVYFGQALGDGVQISDKLNGQNNGRFCWVSSFNCGFFSSTNLIYENGTTNQVNAALATSCTADSDGDGTVNCMDPSPIPGGGCVLPAPIEPPIGGTNQPPGGGGGGGGSTNVVSGKPSLPLPPAATGSGAVSLAATKGTYNGLVYDTNGVTAESSGYFTAKTTDRGAFSGKLVLGGRSYVVAGQFDATGNLTKTVARPGLSSLTITMHLDLNGGDQIRGQVSAGNWTAQLVADRLIYTKTSRTPYAGNYTFVIPGDVQDNSSPAGSGFGTLKVDVGGTLLFSGTLADGTKISQSSAVSKQGMWPLYASLYAGNGTLVSWLKFANRSDSDLQGPMVWTRAAGPGRYYPGGFTNEIVATGSSYRVPMSGARAINLNRGSLVLSGGGLEEPLSHSITLGSNNRVTSEPGSKLTLSITTTSGLFKGSAFDPQSGKVVPFQGVLFKKANIGVGYFLGADQSGEVYLSPEE